MQKSASAKKTRGGIISEDYRSLKLTYEFDECPFGPSGIVPEKKYKFRLSRPGGMLVYKFVDEKTIELEIAFKKSDEIYLSGFGLMFAYLTGGDFQFWQYAVREGAYPGRPPYLRDLNAARPLYFKESLKNFLADPDTFTEKFLSILQDEHSVTHQTLAGLLEIGAVNFIQLRIFVEFSLLETISRREKVATMIFVDGEDIKKLKEFSGKALSLLKKYPALNGPALINKLETKRLNEKIVTKDKIRAFLAESSSVRVRGAIPFINAWATLRNESIAHGIIPETAIEILKNGKKMVAVRLLHQLHYDLITTELENRGLIVYPPHSFPR